MARSWGPVEKPVEHDVKPIAADAEGSVTTPSPSSKHHGPVTGNENYDASDGRHNRADHQGWDSVDKHSGGDADGDFIAKSRFPDGPGKWRQT